MTTARPAVLRYAAFTDDPAGGNPAGVVLDAEGVRDATMLAVAADVGYSETAFVTGRSGERTFTLRYFSPKAEVPFCGHATVATAVALAERLGAGGLTFRTPAGEVPVEVTDDGGYVAEALAALGWRWSELDPALPPRIAYAGARHLVLAAATRERLARLRYDFDRLDRYMSARELTTLQLVWRESADVFHVRDPFPVGGVVEDPATGAAAAAFGAYLRELGELSHGVLTLHQGEDLGRPGVLRVELRQDDPGIRVSGYAVPLPA